MPVWIGVPMNLLGQIAAAFSENGDLDRYLFGPAPGRISLRIMAVRLIFYAVFGSPRLTFYSAAWVPAGRRFHAIFRTHNRCLFIREKGSAASARR